MKKIKLAVTLFNYLLKSPIKLLKYIMHFLINEEKKKETASYGFPDGLPTLELTDLLGPVDVTIHNFTFLEGTSRLPDLAILKLLAKKFKDCDYLEIGSWRGESILNVAENAASCYSLGLSKEEMRAMKFDEAVIALDGYFIKDNKKITRILQNSMTFDFSKMNKKFDLIFVDGDHAYEAVLSDTQNVFKLLKNESSIIVWHDCGNTYEDMRWEVLAAIIRGTPAEKRKYLYRISNSLCGVYTRDNFKSSFKKFPAIPNKVFDVQIKSEMLN